MRQRESKYNPKRQIRPRPQDAATTEELADLAARCIYGGNPEHKRNPGDFNLSPPNRPRPGKTLCDAIRIFRRETALGLLRAGFERGLVSVRAESEWPQNVWAVTEDGDPVEAQLENSEIGQYHGYPMPENDPFRDVVLSRWNEK